MTENKRFELKVNQYDQCDIIDWAESKEKNAICIYNDLGCYYFSSAKALCELLNEFHEENNELKAKVDDKEVAVEVECEKLMHKVFDLIDNSLEKDKREYKMTYEDYLNGRIEVLEELKKAMME